MFGIQQGEPYGQSKREHGGIERHAAYHGIVTDNAIDMAGLDAQSKALLHSKEVLAIILQGTEYIDFSANEELWKEVAHVTGLGECVFQDGVEEGIEKGIEKGIRAMILDNLEENVPEERILRKLQKHFALTSEKAKEYYRQFALDEA